MFFFHMICDSVSHFSSFSMFDFNHKFWSETACCPVRVPSHSGPQACSPLLLLHGWHEAHTYSCHLYHPAHLEHSAFHTALSRLSCQTEPSAGHAAREWDLNKAMNLRSEDVCSWPLTLHLILQLTLPLSVCVWAIWQFKYECAVSLVYVS